MTETKQNTTDEVTVQELIEEKEYAEARDRLDENDTVFKLAAGKAPSSHLDADNRAYVHVFSVADGFLVYYDSVTTCNYDYADTLDFDTFVDWSFDWVLESIEWIDNDNIDEMVEFKIDELDFGDEFTSLLEKHH